MLDGNDFSGMKKRALDSLEGTGFGGFEKRALDSLDGTGFGFDMKKRALGNLIYIVLHNWFLLNLQTCSMGLDLECAKDLHPTGTFEFRVSFMLFFPLNRWSFDYFLIGFRSFYRSLNKSKLQKHAPSFSFKLPFSLFEMHQFECLHY